MADKAEKTKQVQQIKHIPKDAQVIMSIMKDVGVMEYDPRVINQLLELTYRYVTCIYEDAKVYANHAKKKLIDLEDVKMAVESQLEQYFRTAAPREILIETARQINNIPLPLIKPHYGVRLPQDKYCLTGCNLKLKAFPQNKKVQKLVHYSGGMNDRSPKPSPKTINIVKRSSFPISSRTQTVSIPKPIKFMSSPKTIAKPKITITQNSTPMTIEDDDSNPLKRKREDDEYELAL